MRNKLKILMGCGALAAAAIIGDSLDINDSIINPIRYRNTLVANDCYKKPFELRKKYVINEQGFLEVYLGDGKNFYKVEPEIRVHQKSLTQMLTEKGEEILGGAKKGTSALNSLLDNFIKWYDSYLSGEEDGKD